MKDLKLLNHQWFEKKKEGRLIFDPQKEIGKQIVKAFRKHLVITLCAPPQWGKTGVSLFVSYKMSLHGLNKSKKEYSHVGGKMYIIGIH